MSYNMFYDIDLNEKPKSIFKKYSMVNMSEIKRMRRWKKFRQYFCCLL